MPLTAWPRTQSLPMQDAVDYFHASDDEDPTQKRGSENLRGGKWRRYDSPAPYDMLGPDDLSDLDAERFADLPEYKHPVIVSSTQISSPSSPPSSDERPPGPILPPPPPVPFEGFSSLSEAPPVDGPAQGPRYTPPCAVPADLSRSIPHSRRQDRAIHTAASFVRAGGLQAELMLSVRQARNPLFEFLRHDSPLHPYYRWVLQADPEVDWGDEGEKVSAGELDDAERK